MVKTKKVILNKERINVDDLRLTARAKINLLLDVVGKREDGYHEVEMVMQSIDLADGLYFKKIKQREIKLETNNSEVPTGPENLVYKAAKLLFNEYDLEGGVKVRIDKRIPVAAGLAGGSTNAAATLVAINELWDLQLPVPRLQEIGAKLGADVPFCIRGGTVLATGIGTDLERLQVDPELDLVMVNPPLSVPTAEIYQNLNLEKIKEHPDLTRMKKALIADDKAGIISATDNLLARVTREQYSELKELKELILEQGARKVLMSGSGPTMLGFTMGQTVAKELATKLRKKLPGGYVIKVNKTTARGIIKE